MSDLILSKDEPDTETVSESDCPAAPCSPFLDLRCGDCMDVMRKAPDNHWDLAIVDPPYGSITGWGNGGGAVKRHVERMKKWDHSPPEDYWTELFRVSSDQIVWGGNYFTNYLPVSNRWIAYGKKGLPACPQFELAWTSLNVPNKIFSATRFQINLHWGELIHPTQKPVRLYDWLLNNYASRGQRILDTHMGSGSIAIACHYFGAHLTACEIDEEYYNAACERIERETRQMELPLFS